MLVELQSVYQPFLILLAALTFQYFLPIPTTNNPFSYLKILFSFYLKKTLTWPSLRELKHLYSALGLGVICTVVGTGVHLSLKLAVFSQIIEFLLLCLSLQYQSIVIALNKSLTALTNTKTNLSAAWLQNTVLRNTDNMTISNLLKVQVDVLFLRYHYQCLTVAFWYLIAGLEMAVIYRVVFELSQQWSCRKTLSCKMGLIPMYVSKTLQYLPCIISVVLFKAMYLRNLKQLFTRLSFSMLAPKNHLRNILRHTITSTLHINTSHTASYETTKINYKNEGETNFNPPNFNTLMQVVTKTYCHLLAFICLLFFLTLIFRLILN